MLLAMLALSIDYFQKTYIKMFTSYEHPKVPMWQNLQVCIVVLEFFFH